MTGVELRDVDRLPVAWREAGPSDGPLVVLLHGLGGSRTAWNPQLEALAHAGLRAAAWDMPGYGASEPLAETTLRSLADAAAGWLIALGGPAHVVGLSMGGMIAQYLAIDHPSAVCSLSLLDTSPAFGLDGATGAAEWVEQRLASPFLSTSIRPGDRVDVARARAAEQILRAIMGPAVGDEAVAEALEAMLRISPAAFAAAVRCLPAHDTRAELERITAPTQVVVGEFDEETPPAYAWALADAIAGPPPAPLHVVAGVGHIVNLEAPDEVNRLLVGFIRSV